jgi:hypothetical protein
MQQIVPYLEVFLLAYIAVVVTLMLVLMWIYISLRPGGVMR